MAYALYQTVKQTADFRAIFESGSDTYSAEFRRYRTDGVNSVYFAEIYYVFNVIITKNKQKKRF